VAEVAMEARLFGSCIEWDYPLTRRYPAKPTA